MNLNISTSILMGMVFMRKLLVFSAIMMFTIYAMEQSPTVKLFEAFIEDGKLDEFKACSPQLDELDYFEIRDLARTVSHKDGLLSVVDKIDLFKDGPFGEVLKDIITKAENATRNKMATEPAPFGEHLKAYIAQERSTMEAMAKILEIERNKYVETTSFLDGEVHCLTVEKKQ